jgi:hypothetical protein
VAAGPDPERTDREVAEESAGEAIFEGAATGGVAGAVLGWIISLVAKRRRHGTR